MVDASAALSGLLNAGPARSLMSSEQLHAPHLLDTEVSNALRRHVAARKMDASIGWVVLDALRQLGMTRYPTFPFLDRIWQLRDNLSAYDASYVALAELLGCSLVTGDGRLSQSPGIRCPVTVVPR